MTSLQADLQTKNFKALTSLALMETNILKEDYLSTFLPFIATLIIKKNYNPINIGTVVDDFKDEYGISIPRAPMQSILSKAVALGLISRLHNAEYRPVIAELEKISFMNKQRESQSEIGTLLS